MVSLARQRRRRQKQEVFGKPAIKSHVPSDSSLQRKFNSASGDNVVGAFVSPESGFDRNDAHKVPEEVDSPVMDQGPINPPNAAPVHSWMDADHEVDDFFSLLDSTLHLPDPAPHSAVTEEHEVLPLASGRLAERIRVLRLYDAIPLQTSLAVYFVQGV